MFRLYRKSKNTCHNSVAREKFFEAPKENSGNKIVSIYLLCCMQQPQINVIPVDVARGVSERWVTQADELAQMLAAPKQSFSVNKKRILYYLFTI